MLRTGFTGLHNAGRRSEVGGGGPRWGIPNPQGLASEGMAAGMRRGGLFIEV